MRPCTALLTALLVPILAFAQDPGAKEKPVPSNEELAARQKTAGERLAKLEETMERIAKVWEKDNPDEAARLRMAWRRSRDDGNLSKIEEIENLLRENYLNEAFEQQKHLETALQRLLDILLDRDAERKDLQEQIDKLENQLKDLNAILEDERKQFHETEKFASPEKTLQRAQAAMSRLKDLINRQNKLTERTRSPADPNAGAPGELKQRLDDLLKRQQEQRGKADAAAQQALAKEAGALAKDIAKHAQGLPDAMKKDAMGRASPADQAASAVQRATEGMKDAAAKMQGSQPFAERQKDAEQDLREAQDALRRLAERQRRFDQAQLGKDQERLRKDAKRLEQEMERLEKNAPGNDSGAGNVGNAQGQMEKAEGSLSKGRQPNAVPHQQNAKQELEEALKKLQEFEKELKRLIELPDYEKMAERQDRTAEKTDELLKKMKQQQPGPQGGDQQGEPGQGNIEGAKKAMQRGSQNLRGKSAKRANSDQKEAVERLEKAREELEDALRQLREEEQLMLLEALERRLVRMLQKQTKAFKETLSLNIRLKDAKGAPPRALQDKGAQLAEMEDGLAAEADKLLEILEEEGTTVVIPDVVADMKVDLETIAARLRKLDAGSYTQQIQKDVMETLRELIEVIKEELEKRQGGQGQGEGQEGDQDENLLPTSAELKMLKSLQVRVNKRTSQFDRLLEKDKDERGRLAGKQESVGTLTRTMADRLNREEDQ